jgi:hypothetical protein
LGKVGSVPALSGPVVCGIVRHGGFKMKLADLFKDPKVFAEKLASDEVKKHLLKIRTYDELQKLSKEELIDGLFFAETKLQLLAARMYILNSMFSDLVRITKLDDFVKMKKKKK